MLESVQPHKGWGTMLTAIIAGLVAVLTLITVLIRGPVIETDLLQRSRQALITASLPINLLHFSGRDAILQGTIGSTEQAERMIKAIQRVRGVRAVNNQLTTNDKAENDTKAEQASLTTEVFGGKLEKGLFIPQAEHPIEKLDLSGIKFEYAQAQLSSSGATNSALQSIINQLNQDTKLKVEISAHSDGVGTTLGQIALTQARAEAVKAWLVAHNIAEDRLIAKGYGASRPLVANDTEEGRRQNRRIAITVIKPK